MTKTIEIMDSQPTSATHRITITPTRATLKVVPGTGDVERAHLMELFKKAQDVFISTPVSVRASVYAGISSSVNAGATPTRMEARFKTDARAEAGTVVVG